MKVTVSATSLAMVSRVGFNVYVHKCVTMKTYLTDLEDDQHTDDNRDPEGRHSLRSSDSDSDGTDVDSDAPPIETPYVESGLEEFGQVGDAGQTEEVAEENKSLIWALVKQVNMISKIYDVS